MHFYRIVSCLRTFGVYLLVSVVINLFSINNCFVMYQKFAVIFLINKNVFCIYMVAMALIKL